MEFSHELAMALVKSEESHPVDFDDAWRWMLQVKRGDNASPDALIRRLNLSGGIRDQR